MSRLIYYELRKLFMRWPMLIVIIVFSVINTAEIVHLYHTESLLAGDKNMSVVYGRLYENYAGEMTMGKIESLLGIYRPIEQKTEDFTATSASNVEGTLTGNIWMDKSLMQDCFIKPMEYLYTYRNLAVRIVKQAMENEQLFSACGNSYEAVKNRIISQMYQSRSIGSFYSVTGYQFYFHYDFSLVLTILVVLYGLSQVFVRDKECGMDLLLLTNPKGGKSTILAKIIASTLYLAIISLWFSLNDWVVFSCTFGFGDAGTLPVYAVQNFATASIEITLDQYTLVSALSRLLGVWAIGMLFLLAGEFTSHALIPFVVDIVLFLGIISAGIQWSYSSNVWAKVWNPFSLMASRILFGTTEFVNLSGTPVLSWTIALMLDAAIGIAALIVVVQFGPRSKLRKG